MIPIASHDPDWIKYSLELTPKDKLRGFTGYRCTICNHTLKCPPNSFPVISEDH